MVSFLRDAHRLRADLRIFRDAPLLPGRSDCPRRRVHLRCCDPVAVSAWPRRYNAAAGVLLAAFTQIADFRRVDERCAGASSGCHFQYLCAFDAPQGPNDYFKITAAPKQFGARTSMPNVPRVADPAIVKPVNKFTSTAHDTAGPNPKTGPRKFLFGRFLLFGKTYHCPRSPRAVSCVDVGISTPLSEAI